MSAPALHPETPARRIRMAVSGGHDLQLYEWGDPQGQPVLLLHGGPGSGLSPLHARFFDPQRYRLIGVDQRGAGLSTPRGGTTNNTAAELLADLRALREHLRIERWLVAGGSWGATLALLHAADAPDAVAALLLRGVFLARRADVDAFFDTEPAGFDTVWQPWRERAAHEGHTFTEALDRVMGQGSPLEQQALASTWWRFEHAMDGMPSPAPLDGTALIPRYRVQAHYLRHGCFLDDRPLLQRLAQVPCVPTLLLHGARDRICPIAGAEAVRSALPHAVLRRIEDAGHAPTCPAIAAAMRMALDAYAARGGFDNEGPAWA